MNGKVSLGGLMVGGEGATIVQMCDDQGLTESPGCISKLERLDLEPVV